MRIERYIAQQVLLGILTAMFVVLGVDLLFALVRELKHVGEGDYQSWHALQYVLLTAPRRLYNMFPMASLLGTVLGLGTLASYRELVVMRVSGFATSRITITCLAIALLMTGVVTAIGEFLVPLSERVAIVLRATKRGEGEAVLMAHGIWLKHKNSFIHIAQIFPAGELVGVTRFDFDTNQQLHRAMTARRAQFGPEFWRVYDIKKSVFGPSAIKQETAERALWPIKVNPTRLQLFQANPEDLSVLGLISAIHYLQQSSLDSAHYRLVFWQKIYQPLATLTMVLLAIPFVLGPLRSSALGLRLVVAVSCGFSFYFINKLFGPLTLVYHMPPALGALAPSVIVFCAAACVARFVGR